MKVQLGANRNIKFIDNIMFFAVIQCVYNVDGLKYEGVDASILDKIHRKKIDISDAIYVVNIDGYIGTSTKN